MPRKNKPQRTAYREGAQPTPNAPTPEWQAHHDFVRIEAERSGDWREKQEQTVQIVPKLVSWHQHGWIDGEQAKALAQWLQAWQAWGAECTQDSLHPNRFTARSSAGYCRPESKAIAGRRYNLIRLRIMGACGPVPTQTVWEWMRADGKVDYGDEFGVGRTEGFARAKSLVQRVARACENAVKDRA